MMTKTALLELALKLAQYDEYMGICLGCGAEAVGVEPDARGYECDACGAHKVYGAEEILIALA